MNEIILEAMHTGILKLGENEISCYVLNNEKRVLAQRSVVGLISRGRDSGDLGRYLRAKNIQPLLPTKLKGDFQKKIITFKVGNLIAYGLEGSDVTDLLDTYLKARQLGVLLPSQSKIAEMAEIFIRATSKTGIDAVIDEATGYEYFKRVNDLQARLQAYILEGFREWTLTFEKVFFMQLYRLEGKRPPLHLRAYPKRFGRYVMRFIYDTLDPDIADWLRENNPSPTGKRHHHQKFTDFGYDRLRSHFMSVVGIMKASTTMERFQENIRIAFPNARIQRIKRIKEAEREKIALTGQMELEFKHL